MRAIARKSRIAICRADGVHDLKQTEVRIFLASLFGGILYVFSSLTVLVVTAHSYCEHRTPILLFCLLGFGLTGLTIRNAWRTDGSKLIFVIPGTFFVLGSAIPAYIFLHGVRVCAVGAGR